MRRSRVSSSVNSSAPSTQDFLEYPASQRFYEAVRWRAHSYPRTSRQNLQGSLQSELDGPSSEDLAVYQGTRNASRELRNAVQHELSRQSNSGSAVGMIGLTGTVFLSRVAFVGSQTEHGSAELPAMCFDATRGVLCEIINDHDAAWILRKGYRARMPLCLQPPA